MTREPAPDRPVTTGPHARWQAENGAYLSSAIAVVAARLHALADSYQPDPPADDGPAPSWPCRYLTRGGRRWMRRRRQRSLTAAPRSARHSAPSTPAEAEARMADLARGMGQWPPALPRLEMLFGLTRFERSIVTLCAAAELNTAVPALCARAQDDPRKTYPTPGLAMALFDDPEWAAFTPARPLLADRLIEIHQPGATPLVGAVLRLDERILNYLKGHNALDARLAALVSPVRPTGGATEARPAPSQEAAVSRVVAAWRSSRGDSDAPATIQLLGPDPASKRLVAAAAARELGRTLLILPAETLARLDAGPAGPIELDLLARLWRRESRLLRVALAVDADPATTTATPAAAEARPSETTTTAAAAVAGFLERAGAWTMVMRPEPGPRSAAPRVTVEVTRPTPREQAALWAAALGQDPDALAPGLAGALAGLASHYQLDPETIGEIAAQARDTGDPDPDAVVERLWESCRALARPRDQGLAHRIDARATWEELVLPDRPRRLLRTIVEQVRHRFEVYYTWGFAEVLSRGLGLSVLFAGESGTGKTMAAEVIAHELGVDLYRIDLSGVLSKYIGDVEKNLKSVFDAFEDSGAILFFDEADALYGKRTEIKDSHDRYANIAVNYLLQRIEAYRGLAILATNFKSALDPALPRRLRFVVDFPQPGLVERAEIWRRAFPARTPVENLDADYLARLPLNGGSIRVVVLNAAFAAAAEGSPAVAMRHLLEAARAECLKLGRSIPPAAFVPPEAEPALVTRPLGGMPCA